MSSISMWLAGVSAIVLLIACANVANLLLARGIGMQRDMAIRVALGANRRRLISQSMTEAAVLAAAGALAALGVAWWSSRVVHAVILPGVAFTDTGMTRRLLLFIAIAAAITALFAGFLPALQASRAAEGRRGAARVARQFVVTFGDAQRVMIGQITLSVVLLIGAGLFVRSLWSATRTDVGFDLDRTLTVFIEREVDLNADRVARRRRRPERIARRWSASRRCRACGPRRSPRRRCRSHDSMASVAPELSMPGFDEIPQMPGGGPHKFGATNISSRRSA